MSLLHRALAAWCWQVAHGGFSAKCQRRSLHSKDSAVALSGNTAVIAAPGNYTINNNPGAAYVFVRSGAHWSEQAKLAAAHGA
jgi:hypothetical protein